jgi:hypothetical protein
MSYRGGYPRVLSIGSRYLVLDVKVVKFLFNGGRILINSKNFIVSVYFVKRGKFSRRIIGCGGVCLIDAISEEFTCMAGSQIGKPKVSTSVVETSSTSC